MHKRTYFCYKRIQSLKEFCIFQRKYKIKNKKIGIIKIQNFVELTRTFYDVVLILITRM